MEILKQNDIYSQELLSTTNRWRESSHSRKRRQQRGIQEIEIDLISELGRPRRTAKGRELWTIPHRTSQSIILGLARLEISVQTRPEQTIIKDNFELESTISICKHYGITSPREMRQYILAAMRVVSIRSGSEMITYYKANLAKHRKADHRIKPPRRSYRSIHFVELNSAEEA